MSNTNSLVLDLNSGRHDHFCDDNATTASVYTCMTTLRIKKNIDKLLHKSSQYIQDVKGVLLGRFFWGGGRRLKET